MNVIKIINVLLIALCLIASLFLFTEECGSKESDLCVGSLPAAGFIPLIMAIIFVLIDIYQKKDK